MASQGYYNESDYGKFCICLGVNIPQGAFRKAIDASVPLFENVSKDGDDGDDSVYGIAPQEMDRKMPMGVLLLKLGLQMF